MPTDNSRAAPPRSANSIGFLRVGLAAMVIYTHAYYLGGFAEEPLMRWTKGALNAGTLAVQCFFVLSGWLVASSWLRLHSLPVFLWHRILRLGPAFWVCLVVTAVIFGPLIHGTSPAPQGSYWALEPGAAGYVWHNLLQPRAQISIGDLTASNPHPGDLNGSLWTLFYEGACYLAVSVCGLAALLSPRGRLAWILLLAVLLAVHPLAQAEILPRIMIRLFDTPGKLMCWHFATGMACALFPAMTHWLGRRWWPALTGLAALIVAWVLGYGAIVSPLALPPVLFWLAESLPVRNWELRVGGDYSYGLYVYGYPVQQVLAHLGLHRHGMAVFLLLSLLTAGALAWLSWHVIEEPALRLRHAFSPGRRWLAQKT
jgi:peptidoglycan/LPS O-acetylase OafA/YrhL